MLTKNETKYIQSLYHKKQRDEDKLFIAEGPKLAEELLNSSFLIQHIYASSNWLKSHATLKMPVTEISPVELSRISNLQTPNEVVVVARQRMLQHEPAFKGQITIVLDGIQDPGNMGTIIRIADWFGINQIICSTDSADIYNPKVVQSTMGSVIRVNAWYKNFQDWSVPADVPVFGAMLHGLNIYTITKTSEALLVIGNESKGIREPLLSQVTHPVTIPKTGETESLNAAVAAGIIAGCLVNG